MGEFVTDDKDVQDFETKLARNLITTDISRPYCVDLIGFTLLSFSEGRGVEGCFSYRPVVPGVYGVVGHGFQQGDEQI